ncbi:YqgQ family protein [Gracilibacillus sp. YIM 98692]|uniref:YqgQ family protein n=1 Tax=Gracilibacillus sp. YIM 98692 TaxID=2663532 RepID=UPI0013D10C93|nr:YqgQ family protein [Gracilibacillus sp. YIM 98692]
MQSIYEIQKLLMKFGTIIYIGDRSADLELMEEEINELYQVNMITKDEYWQAKLVMKKEKNKINGEG